MASAKEHLAAEVHRRQAEFHSVAAKYHDGRQTSHMEHAALHKELHKSTGLTEDMPGPHLKFAARHEADAKMHKDYADAHRKFAAHHDAAAVACVKAAEDELNKIVPTEIRRIAPDNPLAGLTAIPRHGAAPIPSGMPLEFEKLFKVDAD